MSERIEDIAIKMVSGGKGLLAADESTATIKKRFDAINLVSTEESRRDYREMLFRSEDAMKKYISGVILYDETLFQKAADGTPFVDVIRAAGGIPGIKVDLGAKPMALFPGETVTEGLDGLADRLAKYYDAGARFAKWRGVIAISDTLPSYGSIKANAHALARYAALCQEAKIVPIVEPEVLMDGVPGTQDLARSEEVTRWTLQIIFEALNEERINLEGMILKPSMVIDGKKLRKASVEQVAERTVKVLKETVPSAVPGIAFLSGGQSTEEATAHLSAINSGYDLPWHVTFSYGRALQDSALKAWNGKKENVAAGQREFSHRAEMNSLAAKGSWKKELEKAA
ncbi:class I fructose-bisphosphate aldolase [Rhizobium tubonense]|uniref:Fructose-bisphosphate aldolase n=1 Tax=Rhizobium tubonense TaxID=484088 RepID=A0A2W4C1W0_9HYPH|nr:class I fructose-bisphosphate aldolase [Rhizobium tubonense]PZM07652.1 fructose-bisphosphate aldolase class I [Rhizobium tubonense]